MTTPTPGKCSVVVGREMPHPRERIWRAFTRALPIEERQMMNDLVPRAGHRIVPRTETMDHRDGAAGRGIPAIAPLKRPSHLWNAAGSLKTVVTRAPTRVQEETPAGSGQSGPRAHDEAKDQGARHGRQNFLDGPERNSDGTPRPNPANTAPGADT